MSPSSWTTTTDDAPAPHLAHWRLPSGWRWGREGASGDDRHYQEVVDSLGRSLSLVTAPDESHAEWLATEARLLAHYSHPSIPTTYHFWTAEGEQQRGPGYLRRWIAGETIAARVMRHGPETAQSVLKILRHAGSTLSYLHDNGVIHGALSAQTSWLTPTGRFWLLGWQWAMGPDARPAGQQPCRFWFPQPPECLPGFWAPTALSDQWHLGALCVGALTGRPCPAGEVPPVVELAPGCPVPLARILDRALSDDPANRYPTVGALLRDLDRTGGGRTALAGGFTPTPNAVTTATPEDRLRWMLGDEYEVLAPLGSGTFGSVWQVRDLALGREVALKMLHSDVAHNSGATGRFQREARLAAQLAHPAIVPIYDWDTRGGDAWYTMELAENGSLAERIASYGALSLDEVAPQVERLLGALEAAHDVGVIHRDLKPENILIDRYRQWRLGDFGIAKETTDEPVTTSGTPAFAAPEQLLGELQGPTVDCYGLAAIVAYSLTGTLPFGGGDALHILARQLSGAPVLRGVPAPVADWIVRGLASTPDGRFSGAGSMRRAWAEAMSLA